MKFACWTALVLLAGCGSGGGGEDGDKSPSTSSGPVTVVFKQVPLAMDEIDYITPLGNLNPPDHTFPTDHIYLMLAHQSQASPIFAPADGVVTQIINFGNDSAIEVKVSDTFTYRLGHLLPASALQPGSPIKTGDVLGATSTFSAALDLYATNYAMTLAGFINPGRYAPTSLHADSPLKYFEEPVRSDLYTKVLRLGTDKDGKIDYDQPGKLVGNWFLQGLAVEESFQPSAWSKHLAFTYEVWDPTRIRVSIGGTLAMTGKYAVQSDAPDPAVVAPASGIVAYRLYDPGFPLQSPGSIQLGLLIVEMIGDLSAKVEVFAGSQAATAQFTAAAKIYIR